MRLIKTSTAFMAAPRVTTTPSASGSAQLSYEKDNGHVLVSAKSCLQCQQEFGPGRRQLMDTL